MGERALRTAKRRDDERDFSSSLKKAIPTRRGPGKRPLYLVVLHFYIMSETIDTSERQDIY
ncbi:MAG: hypothetical protein EZS28_018873, partial [Streblomastix strix]